VAAIDIARRYLSSPAPPEPSKSFDLTYPIKAMADKTSIKPMADASRSIKPTADALSIAEGHLQTEDFKGAPWLPKFVMLTTKAIIWSTGGRLVDSGDTRTVRLCDISLVSACDAPAGKDNSNDQGDVFEVCTKSFT
jgi:hypothetical protein